MKYVCDVCGYVYDPAVGDPENGRCPRHAVGRGPGGLALPLCAVGKDQFSRKRKSLRQRERMFSPADFSDLWKLPICTDSALCDILTKKGKEQKQCMNTKF